MTLNGHKCSIYRSSYSSLTHPPDMAFYNSELKAWHELQVNTSLCRTFSAGWVQGSVLSPACIPVAPHFSYSIHAFPHVMLAKGASLGEGEKPHSFPKLSDFLEILSLFEACFDERDGFSFSIHICHSNNQLLRPVEQGPLLITRKKTFYHSFALQVHALHRNNVKIFSENTF